jgi:hypothetical protein
LPFLANFLCGKELADLKAELQGNARGKSIYFFNSMNFAKRHTVEEN